MTRFSRTPENSSSSSAKGSPWPSVMRLLPRFRTNGSRRRRRSWRDARDRGTRRLAQQHDADAAVARRLGVVGEQRILVGLADDGFETVLADAGGHQRAPAGIGPIARQFPVRIIVVGKGRAVGVA